MKTTRQIANEQQQNPTKWDTTSLPSVEEVQNKLHGMMLIEYGFVTENVEPMKDLLTQDRNQAYTRLVEGIKAQVENINGEGSVFDDFATDILENVVKPLYGKTGDKAVDANY